MTNNTLVLQGRAMDCVTEEKISYTSFQIKLTLNPTPILTYFTCTSKTKISFTPIGGHKDTNHQLLAFDRTDPHAVAMSRG